MEKQQSELLQISSTRKLFWALVICLPIQSNVSGQIQSKQLFGKWVLKDKLEQINFPIIFFNEDSSAIFNSRADTLYRFTFLCADSNLVLRDINNRLTYWRIKQISKTKLVLDGLFENPGHQVYLRRVMTVRKNSH